MRCSTGRSHKLHIPLMSRYIGSSPPPSYHQSALVCWGNRTRWCLNLLASPLRITAGSDSQGSRLKEGLAPPRNVLLSPAFCCLVAKRCGFLFLGFAKPRNLKLKKNCKRCWLQEAHMIGWSLNMKTLEIIALDSLCWLKFWRKFPCQFLAIHYYNLLQATPWGNHFDSMQQLPMMTIRVSVLCCSLTRLVGVEWIAVYEATEAYHEVVGPRGSHSKVVSLVNHVITLRIHR